VAGTTQGSHLADNSIGVSYSIIYFHFILYHNVILVENSTERLIIYYVNYTDIVYRFDVV
jgi:hypothetical protein